MITFNDIWLTEPLGALITVRDGTPPPSANVEGIPYLAWRSHNFTGTLIDKVEKTGWRYLMFAIPETERPNNVEYLAYEIPEDNVHTYQIVE